jgi:CDP-glycerol glycerophosphotransferase
MAGSIAVSIRGLFGNVGLLIRAAASRTLLIAAKLVQMGPIDPTLVVYKSFKGEFSDNPRAIFEELYARNEGYRHTWILRRDVHAQLPADVALVPPRSLRCLRALGKAAYIVTNLDLPREYVKKPGVTYVQTWHGTSLKHIGFEVLQRPDAKVQRYLDKFEHDTKRWDVLISPNHFSSEIFARAFRYDGPILEIGYPRNDVLFHDNAPDVRARLRRQLGIKDGEPVVLYVPTWRDNDRDRRGRYVFKPALDLGWFSRELGATSWLLLRLHPNVARSFPGGNGERVRNVSRHGDIRELYLAADVLVTDYSAAMFDFAITGKPMVFYVYDLDEYRDQVRGFYFDLEKEAPGPLVTKPAALVGAVRSALQDGGTYQAGYFQFRQKYCSLDDGRASARLVDAVFRSAAGAARGATQAKEP